MEAAVRFVDLRLSSEEASTIGSDKGRRDGGFDREAFFEVSRSSPLNRKNMESTT